MSSNLLETFFVLFLWVSMWALVEMWVDWMTNGQKTQKILLYGLLGTLSVGAVYFFVYEERERLEEIENRRSLRNSFANF